MADENEDLAEQAPAEEEDPNAQNQTFQQWMNWTNANVVSLRCLLKLADRIDNSDDNNDEGAFEDCDIDSDEDIGQ